MAVLTQQLRQGATRIAAVEFLDALRDGELIASASDVAIERKPPDADDLTIDSSTVLVSTMEINDRDAAAGQGITFSIEAASDQDLGRYVLSGTVTTDSTPAEVIPYCLTVNVIGC